MKSLRIALSAGLAIALATQPIAAAAAKAKPASSAAKSARRSAVEPAALTALQRMSAYLGTLTAFEVKSETSVELVMENGQKTEIDGTLHYLVHRPDGFVIDVATDDKVRNFVYDGKSLTVSAPKLGYYATVSAPPTIRQTLDLADERYDIRLPLEDLFRWSDPAQARTAELKSGWVVGTATIDGAQCDQYAFREGDIDWQIWIERGDKPVPRKVVVVDRTDPAHPEFVARLTWDTAPQVSKASFVFTPPKDAKAIRIAAR
jgi:hypothetical protein